jgi:hypothetical protein
VEGLLRVDEFFNIRPSAQPSADQNDVGFVFSLAGAIKLLIVDCDCF